MKTYSVEAINHFTTHCLKDVGGFNWLMNNNHRELLAVLDANRDDKKAFQYLLDGKHFVLAAFVNSIWEDQKAFKFLMDAKAYDWAASANIINGDEKAEAALKRAGKDHFIRLAHAIQSRIHEDGDRATSPMGVMKNIFDFKKAFKKE